MNSQGHIPEDRREEALEQVHQLRRRAEEKARRQKSWIGGNEPDKLPPMAIRSIMAELNVHQIELEMQNDELRRAYEDLESVRSRYFALYDQAPVGYCTISENGMITGANLTASTLLGAPRSTLVTELFSRFIVKDDADHWYLHRKRLFKTGTAQSFNLRMSKEDGSVFWAHLDTTAVSDEGVETSCRLAFSDITESKREEEALAQFLQEKNALLAELQHRAKNSFTMISGLISMTASSATSPEAKHSLATLDARVLAVAQLYSQLYFSGSFTELRLDEYLSKIAAPLVDLVGPANITLDSAMQAVTVPVRLVAVLGLIVTELITNAIKYAFPGGRKGTIRLSLRKTVAGALLVIGDDGVGFPAASIPVPGSDIGLTIVRGLTMVRGLATQIDGAFEITQAADGTRCVLEFPIGNGSSDPGKDLVHDRV